MQEAKEEVRSRLAIEDVIGEYVQLKRAGRNFKGLSPFSGEKTPSFYVSPDKNIWHDFSSNKGGDVFSFVMEVEGVDFREALELLARKAGIDLSVYDNAGSRERSVLKKRLLEAHKWAAQYYQQSLIQNQRALEYVFKKRGLNKEVVQDFQIGYAPDSGDALVKFLLKKGFKQRELEQAGLTNRFGGDLFRGRMMVPLMDGSGQVIGFTGRIIIDDPKAPKYLNTPQTLLYDKGRHVFGLSQAKETIRTQDYAVVVEGNLDVVSSHQAGIKGVVATAGTALTEHHLKALSRLTPNIRFSFDGDRAGLAATERAIPIAQTVGVEVTVISLPADSKDPDELIQKSPNLWQQAIESAEPVVDWVLRQYAAREDITTAAGKRRYSTAALNVIHALQDPVEKDHYLEKVARETNTAKDALLEKLAGAKAEKTPELKPVTVKSEAAPERVKRQDSLLAVLLIDAQARTQLDALESDMFEGEERQATIAFMKEHRDMATADLQDNLQKRYGYVTMILDRARDAYGDWSEHDRAVEITGLIQKLIKDHKQEQKEVLQNQLRTAEANGDDAQIKDLITQLSNLKL